MAGLRSKKSLTATDGAHLVSRDTFNQLIAQPLMTSFTMVVHHEFCDGPSEMPFTERYPPTETLLLDRPYEALSVAIGAGRLQRRLDDADARFAEQTAHFPTPFPIAVTDQYAIGPVPERPTSWQTFLRAHWGVIAGADFFTTEVWTWRGLVISYTVFVIDLASRRLRIIGSTPHPNDLFMRQVSRTLTTAGDGQRRGVDHGASLYHGQA
jgi:hypothetical protein